MVVLRSGSVVRRGRRHGPARRSGRSPRGTRRRGWAGATSRARPRSARRAVRPAPGAGARRCRRTATLSTSRSGSVGLPRPASRSAARANSIGVVEVQVDPLPADLRLQCVRGAGGGHPPLVEQHDPIGEPVGLLEVLGGEDDRRPGPHQLRDRCPHRRCGWWGRGPWWARRGRSPAARRPGSSPGRAGGACPRSNSSPAGPSPRRGRTARSAPVRAGGRPRRPRCISLPIMTRFSRPVCSSSTAAYWPVRLITARTFAASRTTSWPATVARPPSGRDSVVRMRTVVVFPAPFGPSRASTEPSSTCRSSPSRTTVDP